PSPAAFPPYIPPWARRTAAGGATASRRELMGPMRPQPGQGTTAAAPAPGAALHFRRSLWNTGPQQTGPASTHASQAAPLRRGAAAQFVRDFGRLLPLAR